MPDTLLRVLVLVGSLLLPKEHNGFLEHNDDIIMGMQEREGVLQKERDKLEHELDAVAIDTMLEHQRDRTQSHSSSQPSDHNLELSVTDSNQSAREGQSTFETRRFSAEGEEEQEEMDEEPEPADQNTSQGEDTLQVKPQQPAPENQGVLPSEVSQSLAKEEKEKIDLASKSEDTNFPQGQEPPQLEADRELLGSLSGEMTSDHQGPAEPEASRAELVEEEYDTIHTAHAVSEKPHHQVKELNLHSENVVAVEESDQLLLHVGKDPEVDAVNSEHQRSNNIEDDKTSNADSEVMHQVNTDGGEKMSHNGQYPEAVVRTGPSTKTKQQTSSGSDYMWYLYNAYSVISLICLLAGCLRSRNSQDQEVAGKAPTQRPFLNGRKVAHHITAEVHVPDQATLVGFYERYVHVTSHESQRVSEFVEGFVDDLLTSMGTSSSDPEEDMEVEDFVEVGSLYESWAAGRPLTCDLWVTLAPRKPYSFQVQRLAEQRDERKGTSNDLDLCGYRRVKVLKRGRGVTNGCPCSQAGNDNDMLCLLHTSDKKEDEKEPVTDATNGPLCCEGTPHLSRVAVTKWFRSAVRKAWERTSHKYELELSFQSRESPAAMRVRFRSGKAIHFTLTPVVRFEDTNICLVSHPGPKKEQDSVPDVNWPVSFAHYEKSLLRYLSKRLPQNACHLRCLQTLSFLNKKQTELSGRSFLSSHHLKTVMLHLLLQKRRRAAADWASEHFAERLRDALDLLKMSLQKRWLSHALVGNPLVPQEVGLPTHWRQSEPLNVLQPLVSQVQHQRYAKTVQHLQEMLRNMPVLINEYMDQGRKSKVSSSS